MTDQGAPVVELGEGATAAPVGPGLVVQSPLYVTLDDPESYRYRVRVEPQNGRLVATELTATQRPGGPTVTVEGLRSLAVAPLIRAAAERLESVLDDESGQYRSAGDLTPERVALMLRRGPEPETLDVISYLYRRAVALGDAPAKAIMDTFDITRSKAGRWIAQARAEGFLNAAEGPGKASV